MHRAIAFGASDVGCRREQNEDYFLIDEELGLCVVCDGMGGHAAGEVAAEQAATRTAEYLRRRRSLLDEAASRPGGYFRVLELAEEAVQDACRQLYSLASSDNECAGMGTTLTLLLIVDDRGIMVHVGDSRLYLLRQGVLHLLSNDHTLANEMTRRGVDEPERYARFHHVLVRSVGTHEAVEPDSLLFELLPGDTCLLCSDGLSHYFEDDEEIAEHLQADDCRALPAALVALARQRGGKDNITAVVTRVERPEVRGDGDATRIHDMQRKMEVLAGTFLCRGLSYGRLVRLLEIVRVRRYAERAQIIGMGERCDAMHVVLEGRCSVVRDGHPPLELMPGSYFAETTLTRQRHAHGAVRAEEPSQLLLIPTTEFQDLRKRWPKLGRVLTSNLLNHLSARIDKLCPLV